MSDQELSRLFEAERSVRPLGRGLEQGLSRLLSDVAQRAAPLPVATGSLKLGALATTKWIALGFAVGLVGAGVAAQSVASSAPPASLVAHGAGPAPSALVAAVPPATSLGALPVSEVVAPKSPVDRAALPGAPPLSAPPLPSQASAATFDAELRLISAAKRELDQGRPEQAAAWLREHAERFPDGVFALDREALAVLARCSQRPEAALARGFVAKHPGSPMAERLLHACGAAASAPATAPSVGDFPK